MNSATPFSGEIYVHTNTINGKSYVGQTSRSMEERWHEHVRHSRSPRCIDFKSPLARAIRKYGEDVFEHQILSGAKTKEELDNLERIWIILLRAREMGYNITAGGEGILGLRHDAAALAKMTSAKIGNKHCVGRPCSDETRAKMSQANRGRTVSSEWRAKIAASGRGRKHSAETKAKISANHIGKKFSSAHVANIVAAQQARRARERMEKSNG